jgi:hypothetical protein
MVSIFWWGGITIAQADGFFLEYGERGVSLSIRWLSIVSVFFHILGVLARGRGKRGESPPEAFFHFFQKNPPKVKQNTRTHIYISI